MTFCDYISECPPPCRKSTIGVEEVICRQLNLTLVPAIFPLVTKLIDLSLNNINHITNEDFHGCTKLEILDFSRNSIMLIQPKAFETIVNLKSLNMFHALKPPFNVSFDCLFISLDKLEYVNIQNNIFFGAISLPVNMLSSILSQFPKTLKSIYIDIPGDPHFASFLVNFTNLVSLGINAKEDYKMYITNETFTPLKNLPIRDLTFHSKQLIGVDALAFSWFRKLEYLDMSDSKGIDVEKLSEAWFGMKNSPLKSLILRNFIHKNGKVELKKFFKYFKFDNLTELDLGNTGISGAFDWEFSKNARNLRKLSLTSNKLNLSQIIKVLNNIQNLRNLTCLKLNYQLPDTSSTTPSVRIQLDPPPNLEELDLSEILVWPSHKYHSLRLNFRQTNSLKHLRLNNNFIDLVAGPFIENPNPNVPINIDLKFNKLESLAFLNDSAVRGLRIKSLYLNDNLLGRQMQAGDFDNYHHLERLILTSNEIKELTGEIFINLTKLRILNLNNNCLWLINFEFTHMKNLTMLDLSFNSLTQLNAETRDRIDMMKTISPQFRINLRGNPLECSCSNLPFVHWIYNNRPLFANFETFSCVYNNSLVKFSNIEQLVLNLNFDCSMNLALKLSTSLLALVIVITGLSVFLYRHRWDVRFFFIKFVEKRNVYIEREGHQSQFEYDAFVSYHNADRNWIRHELYKHLDTEGVESDLDDRSNRFRFCIHDRDFTPGAPIEDNIIRAIENSRKTILVLSKSFLTSGWCEFELQMALMESFDKGRNLIIVVMLEPLKIENMSKSLRLLIRKNTYIEWFEDPNNRANFWEKLRRALGSDEDAAAF